VVFHIVSLPVHKQHNPVPALDQLAGQHPEMHRARPTFPTCADKKAP
jgi:hypothetical protein